MNDTVLYARYNLESNRAVYKILSGLSAEERNRDRGSFYGSLCGLFRHVMGGTYFFLEMFRDAVAGNAAALKALGAMPQVPETDPDEAGWTELGRTLERLDGAYVALAESLGEAGLKLPVKLDWYGGKPDSVPVSFMLSQLLVHNTHHRGQISQILDTLKIEHDFSGIGILPE